jgi:peptide/nickel transport system permease protein
MSSRADPGVNQHLTSSSPFLNTFRELSRRPSGLFGLGVVVFLVLLVVFAPFIAPYGPAQQDIENRLQGPSLAHPLGTDHLGRDILSRLIYGTRIALGTALPAVFSAMFVGLVLGLLAGFTRGWLDNLIIVILDVTQAFPAVILALALLSLLGPSGTNVIFVIAFAFMPGYARVVRSQVLAIKENPHIEAERALGASNVRLILVHILPNTIVTLFILIAMDLPGAIGVESGLSFLGLGVRPPTPSWGVILADGFSKIRSSPWPVLWASLMLMVSTLGFTLFGEALRDILDPKLAGARRNRW